MGVLGGGAISYERGTPVHSRAHAIPALTITGVPLAQETATPCRTLQYAYLRAHCGPRRRGVSCHTPAGYSRNMYRCRHGHSAPPPRGVRSDSSSECKDYNTFRAKSLSSFPMMRAHPGPGPHTRRLGLSRAYLSSGERVILDPEQVAGSYLWPTGVPRS